jgi:hypothetical protein
VVLSFDEQESVLGAVEQLAGLYAELRLCLHNPDQTAVLWGLIRRWTDELEVRLFPDEQVRVVTD